MQSGVPYHLKKWQRHKWRPLVQLIQAELFFFHNVEYFLENVEVAQRWLAFEHKVVLGGSWGQVRPIQDLI